MYGNQISGQYRLIEIIMPKEAYPKSDQPARGRVVIASLCRGVAAVHCLYFRDIGQLGAR